MIKLTVLAVLLTLLASPASAAHPAEEYGPCDTGRACIQEWQAEDTRCEAEGSHAQNDTGFELEPGRGVAYLVIVDGGAGENCHNSTTSHRSYQYATLRVLILPLGAAGEFPVYWYEYEEVRPDGRRYSVHTINAVGVQWTIYGNGYCSFTVTYCPAGGPPPAPSGHAWGRLLTCGEETTGHREADAVVCVVKHEPAYAQAEAETYAAWAVERAESFLPLP